MLKYNFRYKSNPDRSTWSKYNTDNLDTLGRNAGYVFFNPKYIMHPEDIPAILAVCSDLDSWLKRKKEFDNNQREE